MMASEDAPMNFKCVKCHAEGECDQFKIIVARVFSVEKNSSVGIPYRWGWRRHYEATLDPWLCKQCQSELYRKAFVVDRLRFRGLTAFAAFLICGGASVILFLHRNEKLSGIDYLGCICIFVCFLAALWNLLARGFISKKRACAYDLQSVFQSDIQRQYRASDVKICGEHARSSGEIELLTEMDWDALRRKYKRDEERFKRPASVTFLSVMLERLQDEGRDLCERFRPFTEWLRASAVRNGSGGRG
jgi:hypothetical protein